MAREYLNLHDFLPVSYANGPGRRAVIWVQGCSLGCPGCFNPQTHPARGGERVSVADLFARIQAVPHIEGVTLSGGEPLQQFEAVLALLRRLRADSDLSVILFSGYRRAEIQRMPAHAELLNLLDVLIAGRYEASQRVARDMRGSANKTLHLLTDRYTRADLQAVPPTEVSLTADGQIVLSGLDPLSLT